jgi:hypothetical protein
VREQERGEASVQRWDPMVVVGCMNLKHWKLSSKNLLENI